MKNLLNSSKNLFESWFWNSESVLLGCIVLLTFTGFINPHSGPSRAIFWLFFTPLTLYVLIARKMYTSLFFNPCLKISIFGLLTLNVVSFFWSQNTTNETLADLISHTIQTAVFITGLAVALTAPTAQIVKFAKLLIISIVIGSSVAMLTFYSDNPIAARLDSDIFLLTGTNNIGPVMLSCLMTAALVLEANETHQRQIWFSIGAAITGLTIFLTQSRQPGISFIIFLLLWLTYQFGWKRTLLTLSPILAALFLTTFFIDSLSSSWSSHLDTGLSGRITIWRHSIEGFVDNPVLGLGSGTQFSETAYGTLIQENLGKKIYHPHNLPLSIMFYLGTLGIILWCIYLGVLIKNIFRKESDLTYAAGIILFCVLLMVTTDIHNLIKSIRPIWWIWWLPTISLLAAIRISGERREQHYD